MCVCVCEEHKCKTKRSRRKKSDVTTANGKNKENNMQTDRQTDGQTHTQTHRRTHVRTHAHTQTHAHTHTHTHAHRPTRPLTLPLPGHQVCTRLTSTQSCSTSHACTSAGVHSAAAAICGCDRTANTESRPRPNTDGRAASDFSPSDAAGNRRECAGLTPMRWRTSVRARLSASSRAAWSRMSYL